ncbi:MAG TPA: YecH family metal-binding protein [Planctomycetota bacterium]|jgi:probable metal-binding protein
MSTAANIHGHNILRLVHKSGALSRTALRGEVERQFGKEARFCTCSTENMTIDELVGFLLERGKLIETGGKLQADISQMCGDDEHGHDHDHAHKH